MGITFVRDGGDALGVSRRAKDLAPEYGIDYRTPVFAIHKKGHYGGIVGHAFSDWEEYTRLVRRAKREGADFIRIMISGIMYFDAFGVLTEEGLSEEEIGKMISIAHEEGMRVMAHGNGDGPVRAALKAGLDTLEHGNYLEQDTWLYDGEPEELIRGMFPRVHGGGDGKWLKSLLEKEGTVWFAGSGLVRDALLEEWEQEGIRVAETVDSCLLERYWFNLYRLEME